MTDKQYLADGYDWKDFSKDTWRDYQKASETGDLRYAAGHCLCTGGEAEIKFALDLAELYLQVKPQRGRVLDVACGSGYMTRSWQNLGFEAIGVGIYLESFPLENKSQGLQNKGFIANDKDLLF